MRWESGDGHYVGGVEGASVEQAFRVVEGYEDGGYGSLISLRKMLGEVLQENVFIFDLEMMNVSLKLEGWARG